MGAIVAPRAATRMMAPAIALGAGTVLNVAGTQGRYAVFPKSVGLATGSDVSMGPFTPSFASESGAVDRIALTAHQFGAILSPHLVSTSDLVMGRTATQAALGLRLG